MKNKGLMNISLNSLTTSSDPSILKAKFIVHDFNKSHNNQVITIDVCEQSMSTLLNKPIVCKYIDKLNNMGVDTLKGHEATYDISRDNGEKIPYQDTIAIGTITDVYIGIDKTTNNNVLFCEADIWLDKYYNICSLLNEWIERGIDISTSVEYIYSSYEIKDTVQYVKSPLVYTALCVLNSENRGMVGKIDPAYDCSRMLSLNEISRWNKAVCEILDKENNSKEGNGLEDKEKEDVVEVVEETTEVVEEVETTEETIEVQEEVIKEADAVEETQEEVVEEVQKSENEVALENKVVELENMIVSLNEAKAELETKLSAAISEKEEIVKQFNEASEMVISLNSQIEEMKPLVTKYNEELYNKQLNEKTEYYKEKFIGLNAKEVFETEEVQGLIVKSINEQDACFKLNAMLVDLVKVEKQPVVAEKSINEITTKIENLIPQRILSVEEKYGFK